jgi:hypothetical protein
MLKDNSSRICTYFAADFEPCLDTKVAEAAGRIQARFSPEETTARVPLAYLFRWPSERCFLNLDIRRIGWQSLGLGSWADNLEKRLDMIKVGLDTIAVEEFQRIGFKVTAYIEMSMSHEELCDLMFGSFLAPARELGQVLGERADPLLQVQGEQNGFKYILVLTPMKPEQIANSFRQHGHLEQFLKDKFLDTGVKDFQERIMRSDCLYFDIDVFQHNVSADRLGEFAKSSLAEAEVVADRCVRRLRSQPITQGE